MAELSTKKALTTKLISITVLDGGAQAIMIQNVIRDGAQLEHISVLRHCMMNSCSMKFNISVAVTQYYNCKVVGRLL
jgi:hypothetical protein